MSLSARAYFNPTQISGCQLWLDAADTSSTSMTFSSGSNLSVWKDKSTSANNFNLISGTPNSVVDGGKNAVYIPSGAVMRSVNQLTVTTSSAYFIVCKLITVGSGSVQEINDILQLINIVVGAYIPFIRFYQGVLQGSATPGNPGNTNDLGNGNYYVNGTFNTNFDSSYYLNKYVIIGLVNPNVGGTTYLSISDTSYPRPFLGNIGEIICYPGGVTSTQRQQLEGYLSQKWGIQGQLPQGHVGISYPFYRAVKNTFTTQSYSTGFNPLSIAGCLLWFDAADSSTLTLSGTAVTRWNDKSGNGYYAASYAGTVTSSTNTINGINAIYFASFSPGGALAIKNSGGATSLTLGTEMTVFIVAQGVTLISPSASQNWGGYFFFSNSAYAGAGGANTTGPVVAIYCTGAYYMVSGIDSTLNSYVERNYGYPLGTYTYNTPAVFVWQPQINNATLNGTVYSSIAQTMNAGSYAQYLGSGGRGDQRAFTMGEVLVYNSSLSASQRQTIESYLAQKWGLTSSLSAGHPNSTVPDGIPRTSVALVRSIHK